MTYSEEENGPDDEAMLVGDELARKVIEMAFLMGLNQANDQLPEPEEMEEREEG